MLDEDFCMECDLVDFAVLCRNGDVYKCMAGHSVSEDRKSCTDDKKNKLECGQACIIGSVVGGAVVLLIIIVIAVVCCCRKKKQVSGRRPVNDSMTRRRGGESGMLESKGRRGGSRQVRTVEELQSR